MTLGNELGDMIIVLTVSVALIAYLCGCFNGAVIVSKYILRDDVRNHGSGNAGLTNFHRTFGGGLTAVVILTDVLKAVVALWLSGVLLEYFSPGEPEIMFVLAKYWAALFCLLGHMFPIMFGFKGGKGILSGGKFHFLVDSGGSGVQCTTEDVGETYYVVYLVGIVGTARGHEHIGTCLHGLLVGNLGFGVCQGKHYGHVCHGAYHVLREHTALAEAQEHVGTLNGLLQGMHITAGGGKFLLLGSKALAVVSNHTLAIEHEDVLLASAKCYIKFGT